MMIPLSASKYLRDHFIGSFVNEAHPSHWDPANDKGVFAITLLCLAYWNAAAGLAHAKAKATSKETIEFMAVCLGNSSPPFGHRYKGRAAIIYSLFRHGLVHHRIPGELEGKSSTVAWVLGRDLDDQRHLLLLGPLSPSDPDRLGFGLTLRAPIIASKPRLYIGLKPDLLFEHSLRAFEQFASQCERDSNLFRAVQIGVEAAKGPREIEGKGVVELVDAALDAPDPWP